MPKNRDSDVVYAITKALARRSSPVSVAARLAYDAAVEAGMVAPNMACCRGTETTITSLKAENERLREGIEQHREHTLQALDPTEDDYRLWFLLSDQEASDG